MTVTRIRAVYEDGHLIPTTPLDLVNGQEVVLDVQATPEEHSDIDEAIRAALGDLVIWPDPSYDEHGWTEDIAKQIAQEISVGQPLSEMILEERGCEASRS